MTILRLLYCFIFLGTSISLANACDPDTLTELLKKLRIHQAKHVVASSQRNPLGLLSQNIPNAPSNTQEAFSVLDNWLQKAMKTIPSDKQFSPQEAVIHLAKNIVIPKEPSTARRYFLSTVDDISIFLKSVANQKLSNFYNSLIDQVNPDKEFTYYQYLKIIVFYESVVKKYFSLEQIDNKFISEVADDFELDKIINDFFHSGAWTARPSAMHFPWIFSPRHFMEIFHVNLGYGEIAAEQLSKNAYALVHNSELVEMHLFLLQAKSDSRLVFLPDPGAKFSEVLQNNFKSLFLYKANILISEQFRTKLFKLFSYLSTERSEFEKFSKNSKGFLEWVLFRLLDYPTLLEQILSKNREPVSALNIASETSNFARHLSVSMKYFEDELFFGDKFSNSEKTVEINKALNELKNLVSVLEF